MSDELTLVGEVSIGALCPLVVGATADVFAELQAKLAGLVQLSATLTVTPPTLAANLQAAIALVAALTLAIEAGLPGIDFQITAVAALIASVEANLVLLLQLQEVLGAELYVYTYSGTAVGFGPAVTNALIGGWPDGSSPASPAAAIVLVATTPAARVGMTAFFGGAV